MQKLSKLIFFLFFVVTLHTTYYILHTTNVSAQVPGLKFPCDKQDSPEFHSLRPYQASPCGDSNKALYCSNDLIFVESFDMKGTSSSCSPRNKGEEGEWEFPCTPDSSDFPNGGHIPKHNLIVELDGSMFPIMGNTELDFDDATKVNEYVSWYLSGVNNKAETGISTDAQTVNFSGPVNKLLPKMIQEAERIETIKKATIDGEPYTDEDTGDTYTEPRNHDQVVVCSNMSILGLFGKSIPTPCYDGSEYRLSDWNGDLSFFRSLSNFAVNVFEKLPDWAKGYVGNVIDDSISVAWNHRFPPLPWDNGTLQSDGKTPNPFKTDIEYKKAYNEWQGKSCVIVSEMLVCVDNPGVTNTYSDLYSYVPLSSTTDKKGAEYQLGDGPTFDADARTSISGAQFTDIRNAPLYFAHTQEVKELSELLNKTYLPSKYQSEKLPETTENNFCSVAKIRVNEGDNLFPGDPDEIQVVDVEYQITGATCKEKRKIKQCPNNPAKICPDVDFSCPAEITIKISTGTKTPNANEIYSTTVADSGSTFRKIFPKIEAGAPVSCIGDMPTVSDVTYTATNTLADGTSKFKVARNPEDGAGENPQLAFPHVGSVYEYFLKGIQTALRPKGYGEPITDGTLCKPVEETKCKEDVPDSAVDSKYLGQFKDNFIDLANRWSAKCPGEENNMAKQCYNFVASEAKKAGVNPAFALTIWLNESGASNYCEGGETTQDMGINIPAIYQNLAEQIKIFNNMAKMKLCDGMSGFTEPMHGWLSRFQSSDGICDPSDTTASNYYYAVKDETWSYLTTCASGGKFGITWPTDMSCP